METTLILLKFPLIKKEFFWGFITSLLQAVSTTVNFVASLEESGLYHHYLLIMRIYGSLLINGRLPLQMWVVRSVKKTILT